MTDFGTMWKWLKTLVTRLVDPTYAKAMGRRKEQWEKANGVGRYKAP